MPPAWEGGPCVGRPCRRDRNAVDRARNACFPRNRVPMRGLHLAGELSRTSSVGPSFVTQRSGS
jgi:hypothetical protein